MINSSKKIKGFTLIELLVVLGILALISLLAIVKYNLLLLNAKEQIDLANISYLNSSTRIYNISTGNWPVSKHDLVPKYIDQIPDSPSGGNYEYDTSTHEFSYSP